jgi:hypothetical protein
MSIKVTKKEAKDILMGIPHNEGTIFSVTFTKKNGEERNMTCRRGVKKGVTGKGLAYSPRDYALLPVYDMEKKDFRMINTDTVQKINLRRKVYIVE